MFKALLRKQFQETLRTFTTGRKGDKPSKLGKGGFLVLYIICFISLCAAFFGVSEALMGAIKVTGQMWLYYSLLALMALAFAVVGSAFSSYTSLYNAKDNELLLSLPIPPLYILIVRMISVYTLGLLFESVVLIPGMIVYWIEVKFSLLSIICPIISLFMIGCFGLALSCVLGWVVGLIAARSKNKNISTVIFTLLFLALYYVFYFNANELLSKLIANLDNIKMGVHLVGSAMTGKLLPLLVVIVFAALVLAAVCYVLSRSFIGIVTKKTAEVKREYKQEKTLVKSSVRKALLMKELKRFTGSAVYMLNCGLGIILMPAMGIFLLIKLKEFSELLVLVPEGFIPVGILSAVILAASMDSITAPAISLEGKYFWVARSLPLKAIEILNSKIELHELLTIPPALITAIMLCIAFKVDWVLSVQIIAAIFVAIVVQAQFGLLLNLKMPNLQWTNEAVPVKKSIPVLISIFGGWLFALIPFGLFFLVRNILDPSVYIIFVLVALVLISRLLGKWMRTEGVLIFDSL